MNDIQTLDQVISDIENSPWYQSTQGQKLSQTVSGIAALTLPVFQMIFPRHITTGIAWIDRAINVIMIVSFGIYSLVGYARAKKTILNKMIVVSNTQVDPSPAVPERPVSPEVVPTNSTI